MSQPLTILSLQALNQQQQQTILQAAPASKLIISDLKSAAQYFAAADIVLAWGNQDLSPCLPQAKQLRWIHSLSTGVEKIINGLEHHSIVLTNSQGVHSIAVAEHALAFILGLGRGLHISMRNQLNQRWKRYPVFELNEQTVGIIGFGTIGRAIAKRVKGLGMKVAVLKRQTNEELFVDCLYTSQQLPELLAVSDYVVMALPLTPETHHFLGAPQFAMMKPSACLINIARGAVVDEAALTEALRNHTIRGAGLDVFEQEPLPATSPLWELDNVIITPHCAALSPVFIDRSIQLFSDQLTRYVNGEKLMNIIDLARGY